MLSVSDLTLFHLFTDVNEFYIILFLSNPKRRDDFLNKVKINSKLIQCLDAA